MRWVFYAWLTRTHGRSPVGLRVYDLKPFDRGAKVTVVVAISWRQSSGLDDTQWLNE